MGGLLITWRMQPVADHLKIRQERSPWMHLLHTVSEPRYLLAFATTALLTTGGFMLMPFSSAFTVNNLGIAIASLPTIYLVTGLCTIFVGPLVGKAADSLGKFPVFLAGCLLTIIVVLVYTHLGVTPLPFVIAINVVMFVGIFSRMVPFQALMSQVPTTTQRGLVQLHQRLGTTIVRRTGFGGRGPHRHARLDGKLHHYEVAGYVVVVVTSLAAATLLWYLQRSLKGQVTPPQSIVEAA